MADSSELAALCAVTALVNVTYAAQHKANPGGAAVASGVGFVGLSLLGGFWRWDVAVAVAGLFLLSAVLMRGLPLIENVSQLGSAKLTSSTKPSFTAGSGSF